MLLQCIDGGISHASPIMAVTTFMFCLIQSWDVGKMGFELKDIYFFSEMKLTYSH